ncbi:S-layer family protein [Nostoc sp. CHAB 5844]|nr:S-layer family protein [Nostoc sp. CHAB 5844]
MTQHRKSSQLVNFLAIGWALSFLGVESSIAPNSAVAQSRIVPDSTLGTENSGVIENYRGFPVEAIIGGTQRGQNLFHSFQEFNVSQGRGAYFLPNNTIQNILARVTGNNVSEIFGTLGVVGNANLFLMNPNGIIFGENARLDVGGSFVATTANAIGFGTQGVFSASERNNPSPLLTINPTAFLFNQIPKAAIVNRAFGSELSEFIDIEEVTDGLIDKIPGGLRVPNGRSVILLGGDVNLEGGEVGTFGGRVEIGGLSAPGTVGLNIDGNNFSLQFPQGIPRADVSLSNESTVYAFPNGGDITINARNLNLSEASEIDTALSSELSALFSEFSRLLNPDELNPAAGEITINATESVNLQSESFIGHVIFEDTFNQGGGIRITTRSLNVQNSGVSVLSFGQGNLGDVNIQASDRISLDGVIDPDDTAIGGILVSLFPGAVGQGGDIRIVTGSLSVTNGAELNTTTFGSGNAGNIIVKATDNLILDGSDSGIFSLVLPREFESQGNGGDIKITTGLLTLTNGAQINTSTLGEGKGGDITIKARDRVFLGGTSGDPSVIGSAVGEGSTGESGSLDITTGSLILNNGGKLNTSIQEGGRGDAGNIRVQATDTITFDNQGNETGTGIFSIVSFGVPNRGGDVEIKARSLNLLNGGQINTLTIGEGNAGNVNIEITDYFAAINGSLINTRTLGRGNAGNVNIKANNNVVFDNSSGVVTGVFAFTGIFRNIINVLSTEDIDDSSLRFLSNLGDAGDIDISARSIQLNQSSGIITFTTSGDGGDIRLQAQDFLLLRRGSSISAQAGLVGDGGNGGNITINTPFLLAGTGENTDIVANAFSGNGGRVEINAQGIFGFQVLNRAEIERLLNNAEVFTADQIPTNDIVVFSQTNSSLDGEVALNTPDVDPTQGLVDLPTNVVDSAGLIEQSCAALNDETGNQFIITGRGGLPTSPEESLGGDVLWSDTRLTVTTKPQQNAKTPVTRKQPTISDHVAIVPASGWVSDRQGKVTLVAHSPNVSTSKVGYQGTHCQAP